VCRFPGCPFRTPLTVAFCGVLPFMVCSDTGTFTGGF
jgi:hypothetical protein